MGIKYLHYYARSKNLRESLNVRADIEMFKSKNNNSEPIIVVDFNAWLRIFIGNETLYGTRSTKYSQLADIFCKKMKKLGAKLVFCIEGPIKPEKLSSWIERKNSRYTQEQRMHGKIRKGSLDKNDFKEINVLGRAYDNTQMVLMENECSHVISLENECDLDICSYANANNALAVIANDTDFLAMPGDWDMWDVKDFNLFNMSGFKINKAKLRGALNLQKSQMPAFATLCGNDFVPIAEKFIETLEAGYNRHNAIAAFINQHKNSKLDAEFLTHLISTRIDCEKSEIMKSIEQSLSFYNCVIKTKEIDPNLHWLIDFTRETLMTFAYTIKMREPFTIDNRMIDLTLEDFKSFSQIVLPLIQRQAGVILADETNKNENEFMMVYFKPSHTQPYNGHKIPVVYPSFSTPPFKALSGKDPSMKITDDEKIEIFLLMTFGKKLEIKQWKNLLQNHSALFLPVVALYYLIQEKQIKTFEADAVLLSIYKIKTMTYADRDEIAQPEPYPTSRSAWLAFTYIDIIYYFINALTIAGLNEYRRKDYFDGYLYHSIYSSLETNPDGRNDILQDIQEFRLYVNKEN